MTRDDLVIANQGYVRHLALRLTGPGPQLDDLVQAGNIGLLTAIDAYDPTRGASLPTFATKHILGEMRRYLASEAWTAHVPRRVRDLAIAARDATDAFTRDHGRSPTVTELAERLAVTPEAILDALEAGRARGSAPIDDDADRGADDRGLAAFEDRHAVEAMLASLPEREREIVRLTYFDGLPQTAIAERLGISQIHVSRLHRRAMDTLRGTLDQSR